MAADESVVVDIRTMGAARAAAETNRVATGIGRIGKAAGVANTGLQNFRRNTNLGSTATYALHRAVFVTGAGLLGFGALAARSGLQFNATMEQNQVAFQNFLGSAQAARKELQFLYHTAAVTPFETANITDAARKMMAFGFSAKATNSWLTTIGDTISGIGGGPEQIQQLVLALGQIKSKGRLQGDELMQLSELGVVNRTKLAKQLGVTPLALSSGTSNIPAAKALAALQKQWSAPASKGGFAGMASAEAKTFNGQLSTLHDNLNMVLGKVTYPGFDYLRRTVFPVLSKASDKVNAIFSRNDLTTGQKFHMSEAVLNRQLSPIAHAIQAQIKRAHISTWLGHEFSLAAPHILNTGAGLGVQLAKGMWNGFMHAGPYGKLFAALWLGKKTGALGGAFKLLTGGVGGLGGRGGSPARPLFVSDVLGGGGVPGGLPGKGKGGTWLGNLSRKAAGLASGFLGLSVASIAGTLSDKVGNKNDPRFTSQMSPATRRRLGLSGDLTTGRDRAAMDAYMRGNLPLSAVPNHGPINLQAIIKIGEREFGQAIATSVQDAHARRGGR